MEDNMVLCPKCGTKFISMHQHQSANIDSNHYRPANNTTETVKKKSWIIKNIIPKIIVIVICLFMPYIGIFYVLIKKPFSKRANTGLVIYCVVMLSLIVSSIALINNSNDSNSSSKVVSPLESKSVTEQAEETTKESTSIDIDITKFSHISGSELLSLLGNPDKIRKDTWSSKLDIPCFHYDYNNSDILGDVSFTLVKDEVVSFVSKNKYPYDKNTVFDLFGIEKGENASLVADTRSSLRYRSLSETVDDFWIKNIRGDSFSYLLITFYYDNPDDLTTPLSVHDKHRLVSIFIPIVLIIFIVIILRITYKIYQKNQKKKKIEENTKRIEEITNRIANNEMEMTPYQFFSLREKRMNGKMLMNNYNFAGIYILCNKTKNKHYVGQSKDVFNRVNEHFGESGSGNKQVYVDYKMGDKFTIKMLSLEKSGFSNLNELESFAIERYDAFSKGYNKTKGNRP